uniref:Uncharacterized protein n=1 Tax=Cacopsylla melanoneura TaxID=428564 RepID=A0A8D8W1N6_9HEMI
MDHCMSLLCCFVSENIGNNVNFDNQRPPFDLVHVILLNEADPLPVHLNGIIQRPQFLHRLLQHVTKLVQSRNIRHEIVIVQNGLMFEQRCQSGMDETHVQIMRISDLFP